MAFTNLIAMRFTYSLTKVLAANPDAFSGNRMISVSWHVSGMTGLHAAHSITDFLEQHPSCGTNRPSRTQQIPSLFMKTEDSSACT
jgi:hypothetical protein